MNAPLSYKVGRYTVRQEPGAWRVYTGSVAIFHSALLSDAFRFAQEKADEYALTVKCTLCGSRPGIRCYSERGQPLSVPHMARHDARERADRRGSGQ